MTPFELFAMNIISIQSRNCNPERSIYELPLKLAIKWAFISISVKNFILKCQ